MNFELSKPNAYIKIFKPIFDRTPFKIAGAAIIHNEKAQNILSLSCDYPIDEFKTLLQIRKEINPVITPLKLLTSQFVVIQINDKTIRRVQFHYLIQHV